MLSSSSPDSSYVAMRPARRVSAAASSARRTRAPVSRRRSRVQCACPTSASKSTTDQSIVVGIASPSLETRVGFGSGFASNATIRTRERDARARPSARDGEPEPDAVPGAVRARTRAARMRARGALTNSTATVARRFERDSSAIRARRLTRTRTRDAGFTRRRAWGTRARRGRFSATRRD